MDASIITTEEEIRSFTTENTDWRFENDRLVAEYVLTDFDAAMGVVNKVAEVAREMDHHPLWTNVYNRLTFSLCTHSAGDKVTALDIEMAKKISTIIAETAG